VLSRQAPTYAIIIIVILCMGAMWAAYWYYLSPGDSITASDPSSDGNCLKGTHAVKATSMGIIPPHPHRKRPVTPAPAVKADADAPQPQGR
jgi:hypothetical protein